ncbi:MAG: FHA domain-containing protein [Candidatus Nitrospinota bacterium M3_3B_026]
MAKLTISFKDKVLQEIEINKSITVGREVGDIMIKNPAVSARHMRIEKSGARYVVRDLGSTNGTLVNDVPVTEKELRSGDVITVGRHTIKFDNPDEAAEPSAFEEDMGGRTLVMDSAKLKAMMEGTEETGGEEKLEETQREGATPSAGDDKPAKLFLSQPPGAPRVISLDRETTLIGSSDKNDVRIKGITIGRVAAEIRRKDGEYEIEFKGGMARLKVDGKPVEKRKLVNGDKFSISSYNFEFRTEL